MDALTRLVSEKTGISQDQARTAVETVLGFVKEKLPAPIAAQVESAIQDPGAIGQASSMLGSLGGMLGGGDK